MFGDFNPRLLGGFSPLIVAIKGLFSLFTISSTTAAPNGSVTVNSIVATGPTPSIDIALVPKASGSLLGNIPNNLTSGGNKRGISAVDWQLVRTSNIGVASGNYSVLGGGKDNRATGTYDVVAGGTTNVASGGNSFVGSGDTNTASAQYAAVVCGSNSTAGGLYSFIGGGFAHSASQSYATVSGGNNNTASGQQATVGGGTTNTADGTNSTIMGGANATVRGINGAEAYASGTFAALGDAERRRFIMRIATTDATATVISTNNAAAASTNQAVLPNTSTFDFSIRLVSRSSADQASFKVTGLITRGANAAATALVGTPTVTTIANSAGASAWVVAVTADTTLGCIKITVTGAAATNIKWVADVETVEVVG